VVGGWVLAVVASVVVVGAAVVVGPVTGCWLLVTPAVKNASLLVVVPALAGAAAGPAALVGLLTARGPVAEMGVERMGAVAKERRTTQANTTKDILPWLKRYLAGALLHRSRVTSQDACQRSRIADPAQLVTRRTVSSTAKRPGWSTVAHTPKVMSWCSARSPSSRPYCP
jgi:hypothetical protein